MASTEPFPSLIDGATVCSLSGAPHTPGSVHPPFIWLCSSLAAGNVQRDSRPLPADQDSRPQRMCSGSSRMLLRLSGTSLKVGKVTDDTSIWPASCHIRNEQRSDVTNTCNTRPAAVKRIRVARSALSTDAQRGPQMGTEQRARCSVGWELSDSFPTLWDHGLTQKSGVTVECNRLDARCLYTMTCGHVHVRGRVACRRLPRRERVGRKRDLCSAERGSGGPGRRIGRISHCSRFLVRATLTSSPRSFTRNRAPAPSLAWLPTPAPRSRLPSAGPGARSPHRRD
jgi:hypothetical protein